MKNEEIGKIIDQAVEDFGLVVRDYRVRNFLSLQELADVVSCSPAYLWRIEQHRRTPSLDFKIRFLEQALGLSTADIFQFLQNYMKCEETKREIE